MKKSLNIRRIITLLLIISITFTYLYPKILINAITAKPCHVLMKIPNGTTLEEFRITVWDGRKDATRIKCPYGGNYYYLGVNKAAQKKYTGDKWRNYVAVEHVEYVSAQDVKLLYDVMCNKAAEKQYNVVLNTLNKYGKPAGYALTMQLLKKKLSSAALIYVSTLSLYIFLL